MATFCANCGAALAEGTAFCSKCGRSAGSATGTVGTQSGLAENVAGLLCYVLGWITGLIFFLIDKRPSVRFHAAQSIVVFGALHVVSIALRLIFGFGFMMGGWTGFSAGFMLIVILNLVGLVLWILLMIKAYQGERFEVPIAAGIAKGLAGS